VYLGTPSSKKQEAFLKGAPAKTSPKSGLVTSTPPPGDYDPTRAFSSRRREPWGARPRRQPLVLSNALSELARRFTAPGARPLPGRPNSPSQGRETLNARDPSCCRRDFDGLGRWSDREYPRSEEGLTLRLSPMTARQHHAHGKRRLVLGIAVLATLSILAALMTSRHATRRAHRRIDVTQAADFTERARCAGISDGGPFEYHELQNKDGLSQTCKCDRQDCCECY
jgi:hypothetical protein